MVRIFARKHYLSPRYSKACCSAIAYVLYKGLTRYSIAHAKKQSPLWIEGGNIRFGRSHCFAILL